MQRTQTTPIKPAFFASASRLMLLGLVAIISLLSLDSCKTGKPSYSRASSKFDSQPRYYTPRVKRYAVITPSQNSSQALVASAKTK
jgi:hypothetical protein